MTATDNGATAAALMTEERGTAAALATGSPPSARAPLPRSWLHRTPRHSYHGPLEDLADGEVPQRASESFGARVGRVLGSALRGAEDGQGAGWLHVLTVLVRTDFRARYRGQALGMVWSVLYPLVMMGIMSLIFTQVFRSQTRHFPIFLLIGLIFWQWVTSSVTAATQVFVSHADIIKRTVFARQLMPIAVVLSYGINCAIESVALLIFLPIFPGAFKLSWALLTVPVLVVLLVLLLSGVALGAAVLYVIYRDVAYIVSTGLLLLYWLTPVVYPVEVIPYPYRMLIQVSPLAGILHSLRHAIMDGQPPTAMGWAGIVLPCALLFGIGWLLFRHYERMVLDYV